jgi:hypothetical protein
MGEKPYAAGADTFIFHERVNQFGLFLKSKSCFHMGLSRTSQTIFPVPAGR